MAIPKLTPSQAELASTKTGAKKSDGKKAGGKEHADKHGHKHRAHKQGKKKKHKHKRRQKRKHQFRAPDNTIVMVPNPAPAPAPSAAQIAVVEATESRPGTAYSGTFGVAQANRLLSRAGFGPRPGQANELVSMGLVGAVQSLTRPSGAAVLTGPPPTVENEHGEPEPLAPADLYGQDHLWWLDRMIRTNQPLVERMALVFHDWFATSNATVNNQQMMIDQSNLFRSHCFGSFLDLFKAVTINPAMLLWLNGAENVKEAPNENYGREMMELFSLGADRGAYTEDDIREQARGLTGWTYDYGPEGPYDFRFDPERHDDEDKTVFGRTGNWNWEDACTLCVENPYHPSFFVTKLWSYFVPTPPSPATEERLIATYTSSGLQIRPVLEEILLSPDFYEGQSMVRPPVVHLAAMMRAVGRYVDTSWWVWLCEQAGQQLFWPPNVAGWDDTRWLDTSRMRARWNMVSVILGGIRVDPAEYPEEETADEAVARALAAWANPEMRSDDQAELVDFARRVEKLAIAEWDSQYPGMRHNALLQLVGISPDVIMQ